jgi:hypothetical protein
MNLHLAYKATGERIFQKIQERLPNFLARVQIQSNDALLDGNWMRAFDYRNWQYYGSNAAIGCGPYAVEIGWLPRSTSAR